MYLVAGRRLRRADRHFVASSTSPPGSWISIWLTVQVLLSVGPETTKTRSAVVLAWIGLGLVFSAKDSIGLGKDASVAVSFLR